MCTIYLKNILASTSDLPQAGDIFYNQVMYAESRSEKVVVNMEDVTSLPSIFLNVSIGRIIDGFGIQWVKDHLSFTRITKAQAMRLTDYLSRYKTIQ